MKENISKADILVVVVTPRYYQNDYHRGKQSTGFSEMLHVESGMAFANDIPVIVFIKEGTNVGSFLPNLTQPIILKGDWRSDKKHRPLINSIFDKATKIVDAKKDKKSLKAFGQVALFGLAAIGVGKVLSNVKITQKI